MVVDEDNLFTENQLNSPNDSSKGEDTSHNTSFEVFFRRVDNCRVVSQHHHSNTGWNDKEIKEGSSLVQKIFIRFVVFLTEIVAETWNTDVDSSTQDAGNQHDDARSNGIIRNVVFIRPFGDKHSIK